MDVVKLAEHAFPSFQSWDSLVSRCSWRAEGQPERLPERVDALVQLAPSRGQLALPRVRRLGREAVIDLLMQAPTLSRNLRLLGLEGGQFLVDVLQALTHQPCIGSHIDSRDLAS
jgi:hypothetical protein